MQFKNCCSFTYGPEIFFQVLLTTTRFSSVLSCEDLLEDYCKRKFKQTNKHKIVRTNLHPLAKLPNQHLYDSLEVRARSRIHVVAL